VSIPKLGLLAALALINLAFVAAWVRRGREHPNHERPTVGDVLIGVVTDFLDALASAHSRQPPLSTSCAAVPPMSSFRAR